jgi:predicted dehydrogenase
MIRVGIVGLGFMGWIHYLAYRQSRGVKLAAVCEQDPVRLAGDWRSIKGNFGPPGELVDLSGIAKYAKLEDLVADPNLDLIDICLPPAAHASAAILALQAGKHVFSEKPMSLTTADCQRMVDQAQAAGRQLLVGHVLPFFPEYAHALKLIRSGEYGTLLGGAFKRVISDPLWLKDFYDLNRCGGPLIDLHIHDAHFIRLLFGMPTGLISQGRMKGGTVSYCNTQFRFADPSLVVTATSGVIDQQGRPFTHGFEIHLERATLHYESAAFVDHGEAMPLKILTDKGDVVRPHIDGGDPVQGFVAEIAEVLDCVAAQRPSPILSAALARDAIILSHKQAESVKAQRFVTV